jgi:Rnl2 family RNA ligase
MKFEKYPSLVRSDVVAKGSKLNKYLEGNEDTWYATEKLHGCNFAIYYDGFTWRYAKRTAFLDWEDELFAWQDFFTPMQRTKWQYAIRSLRDNWDHGENMDYYKHIVVYGEFFGGEIQDNVQYEQTLNNTKEFRIFNVFGYKGHNTYDVMGYDKMKFYFGEDNLVPYITKGKVWDVLRELDMEAESFFGGISEGYVVQKYADREWKSGDTFLGIKHKTRHFTEVAPAKLNDLIGRAATLEDLKRYITDNRLDNIASKGYTMTRENMGELMDVLMADIFEDYEGDIPEKDQEGYKNQLRRHMAQLIYTHINRKENLARSKK